MILSSERDEETGPDETRAVSISRAIFEASQALRNAGVPEARREAGSLLAHALDRDRTFIISHAKDLLSPAAEKTYAEFVNRRAQGEPLQYITGLKEFFGLRFKVTNDVLIPRPETELLVEAALSLIGNQGDPSLICDLGTGSGCIAVTLLHLQSSTRAVALDVSEAAIQVAQTNAIRHNVTERISFVVSDCFDALKGEVQRFDFIVSNPPYVSAQAVAGLQREVRDHEPRVALTPGGDGLSIIRSLLKDSPNYLKAGGYLLFEIGFDQGAAVHEMIQSGVWRLLDIQPDLQGIPRIVALQKT